MSRSSPRAQHSATRVISGGLNRTAPAADTRERSSEEARGDATDRPGPVCVARIPFGEDGDRDPRAAVPEQRRLVRDPAGAGAPAALEENRPALRRDRRNPPALRRDDRPEQPARVAAVPLRHVAVDAKE